MLAEIITGPLVKGDGAQYPARGDKTGALVNSDIHGKLFEAARLGRLFSNGMGLTDISNTTFTINTLGATCTPICGVYNPLGSGIYLSIILAKVVAAVTAATATGPGGFSWATQTAQSAITTGSNPLNRKTLLPSGSGIKGMAGIALTGLAANLVVREASAINVGPIGNFSQVGTAVGFVPATGGTTVDLIDGGIIVPPGGVLALLANTIPVALSAASSLLWEQLTENEI